MCFLIEQMDISACLSTYKPGVKEEIKPTSIIFKIRTKFLNQYCKVECNKNIPNRRKGMNLQNQNFSYILTELLHYKMLGHLKQFVYKTYFLHFTTVNFNFSVL